jgi:N-acetylneuraminic acid mutarotase
MLVWGGQNLRGGTYLADGEAFDSSRGTWAPIPTAPLEPRGSSAAVWTGSRVLVWGGEIEGPASSGESFADGASYDPRNGTWTELAPSPLEGRTQHTAVWTGSRMVVWGGAIVGESRGRHTQQDRAEEEEGGKLLADGAAYDPASNQWTMLPPAPIGARAGHVAVWTGREMLVWGGATLEESEAPAFSDGAAYDPVANTWRSIGIAPPRTGGTFTAVWTGRVMLVWGGLQGQGAAYDPATNRWTLLPKSPLPPLSTPTAVWTGHLMLVWGALENQPHPEQRAAVGAAYDPAHQRWMEISHAPSAPGYGQTAVWTGRQMIVWGGFAGPGPFSSGAVLTLPS